MVTPSPSVEKFLRSLNMPELLWRMGWEEWIAVNPPFEPVDYKLEGVTVRYERNGYQWDMHASLYTPETDVDPKRAFALFHGGSSSENTTYQTPDERPGFAQVLARQGFKVIAFTYTGHYPPGGTWAQATTQRLPVYLLDQDLPIAEIMDRNRKCTFNTILQGAGLLTDKHLKGREILAFGHSTGGPMAAHLTRFTKKTKVIGLVGFGTGGPDGWRKQWREETGAESDTQYPMDEIRYETPDRFLDSGYDDPPDLTPWGGAAQYLAWCDKVTSQMKTGLCNNQHRASVEILEEYARQTGLPRQEYLDHLDDPDPKWLKTIAVLLLVGEKDKGHWVKGNTLEDKREMFMGRKYAAATRAAHVVVIPRYGHCAYVALHNEKFVYLWLWALKCGYFDSSMMVP